MTEPHPIETKPAGSRVAFWITLARATLATALGVALILQPVKTRPILVNFIGVFWLVAGIMSLRWNASGERARPASIVIGIVGVLAGVLVLGRFLIADVVGETPMTLFLGGVVVLTGIVHAFDGFRTGPDWQRQRSWASTLLGTFEIVLGVLVLVWQEDFGPVFYAVATIWAFAGALVLLREALRKRASAH